MGYVILFVIAFIVVIFVVFLCTANTKENNNNNVSCQTHGTNTQMCQNDDKKYIVIRPFLDKYMSSIPESVFNNLVDLMLKGEYYAYISMKDYEATVHKHEKIEAFNKALYKCATLNNEGIQLEKEGNIEEAIKVYEKNIKGGYPACHSYDRLMIIYRRQKDYDNEIRIIKIAIQILGKANPSLLDKYKSRLEKARLLKEKLKAKSSQ